jgi:hypothetical protein
MNTATGTAESRPVVTPHAIVVTQPRPAAHPTAPEINPTPTAAYTNTAMGSRRTCGAFPSGRRRSTTSGKSGSKTKQTTTCGSVFTTELCRPTRLKSLLEPFAHPPLVLGQQNPAQFREAAAEIG